MKSSLLKGLVLMIAVTALLSGCGNKTNSAQQSTEASNAASASQTAQSADTLQIQFGQEGETFEMDLEDNETAKYLATFASGSGINLPVYHFDDFEGYEYMQRYDIPARYEIPAETETVTSEKAGEIYFAPETNSIILFYQDAQESGEYTKIGTINSTDGLKKAVEENPVVEGWSNKIVSIRAGK